MVFRFKPPIDPENPADEKDPPPEGWQFIGAREYAAALHGFPIQLFTECQEWENRELARIQVRDKPKESISP